MRRRGAQQREWEDTNECVQQPAQQQATSNWHHGRQRAARDLTYERQFNLLRKQTLEVRSPESDFDHHEEKQHRSQNGHRNDQERKRESIVMRQLPANDW